MADKSYRVIAPYVTLKVKDVAGATVITGFHQGGIVSQEVEEENLQHHLDMGMLEEAEVSEDGQVENGDFDLGPSGAQAPTPIDRFPGEGETGGDAPKRATKKSASSKSDS